MSLLSKAFGRKSPIDDRPVEHAGIVHFDYGGSTDLQPIFAPESELAAAIDAAKAGEYDGHEVAVDGSDGFLCTHAPDADRLLEVVRPVLEACTFMRGARVTLRYGPPEDGVVEQHVPLGS